MAADCAAVSKVEGESSHLVNDSRQEPTLTLNLISRLGIFHAFPHAVIFQLKGQARLLTHLLLGSITSLNDGSYVLRLK